LIVEPQKLSPLGVVEMSGNVECNVGRKGIEFLGGEEKMMNEREEKYWRYRKYRELLEKAESMERKLKMMEMEMWKICRLIQELGDDEEDDF